MVQVDFKRLTQVDKSELIALMNHPLVRRQMPLLKDHFDEAACTQFIAAKELLWSEKGYGPWAFVIDGKFAGWGGVQPEDGFSDLALVLHPNYWGMGKLLYEKIIQYAFTQLELNSISVLFPTSRTRVLGLLKLGFQKEGILYIGREQFVRYSLLRSNSRQ